MSLSTRDSSIIWHPYTQMHTALPPIGIVSGKGAWLYEESGKRYLDAISSWWTNLHGHSHPYLAEKIHAQALALEHLIFAGFTHEPAVRLAEMLLGVLPEGQKRVFYSDNGSTAVEVGLKMALQFWHNKGEKRTKIIALKEAYHGDTFGAMSVSGRSAFTGAFDSLLFDVYFIEAPLPGREELALQELKSLIAEHGKELAAFIYEPMVQGTAGMRMMDADGLNALVEICQKEKIICIADEVMTGFGRTGKMFASEYLRMKPDVVCLSKGLTGGMMAFGVTTCSNKIYHAFLSEDKMKTFFHGHSYTANPIACTAGIASLELFEKEQSLKHVKRIEACHRRFADRLKGHKALKEVRLMGVILVLELEGDTSYFHSVRDKAYAFFLEKQILIRPLGNVIYLMPPYCITDADLDYIYSTLLQFLNEQP
ncbi:MAG TPA: adenosylmethionine--8-amino-7-oxononanoate transaminase [Bacteroidia bacterium]|jgi:adenosylmethionine-8-amino-7-oxononanoate aminotransferase|nr:adenosylmethionine--8-amino-7-oxononanoate transaminase [Bacteroidia bacterium]